MWPVAASPLFAVVILGTKEPIPMQMELFVIFITKGAFPRVDRPESPKERTGLLCKGCSPASNHSTVLSAVVIYGIGFAYWFKFEFDLKAENGLYSMQGLGGYNLLNAKYGLAGGAG